MRQKLQWSAQVALCSGSAAVHELERGENVKRTALCLIWILGLLPCSSAAQTKVAISVNADYRDVVKHEPIAPDFAGLSFEITSVMPGTNGLAAGVHFFDPQANPQPLALFQQVGIKSLRVGAATGDGCRTPFPTHADLDALFHFAQQANLKIIYQFRMINPVSCELPNLEQESAETAQYLWSHYARSIAALSTGNEDDYHTAHSFCTDGRACVCLAGRGCSCLASDPQCTHSRAGMAPPALVIRDPQMYEIGVSEAMTNAGSAFPSYLNEWRNYMGMVTKVPGLSHVPVAGPDAFSYTLESRFTGSVCGTRFTNSAWPELLAACENLSGGWAVARNQDNSLQAFAATAKGVYTARQETPGGTWSGWRVLGDAGRVLLELQAAQNADGSLCVLGLDRFGDLWRATEAAPGVAWSPWKMLPKLTGGIRRGFSVAEKLNGRISVFVLDGSAHPALWEIGQRFENGWDEHWSRLGAPHGQILQPNLQAGRTLAGKLTVFALDQSGGKNGGSLWTISQNSPGGPWGNWSALPGIPGVPLRSRFVTMQNSDGRFEVVAAGAEGKLYRLAQKAGGKWGKTWLAISGGNGPDLTHLALVAGTTEDGRLQIFATDEKGMVYSNWQQTPGGKWQSHWSAIGNQKGLAFAR